MAFWYGLLAMPCIPPPPQQMATVVDGMHPTGMHSCFFLAFPLILFLQFEY